MGESRDSQAPQTLGAPQEDADQDDSSLRAWASALASTAVLLVLVAIPAVGPEFRVRDVASQSARRSHWVSGTDRSFISCVARVDRWGLALGCFLASVLAYVWWSRSRRSTVRWTGAALAAAALLLAAVDIAGPWRTGADRTTGAAMWFLFAGAMIEAAFLIPQPEARPRAARCGATAWDPAMALGLVVPVMLAVNAGPTFIRLIAGPLDTRRGGSFSDMLVADHLWGVALGVIVASHAWWWFRGRRGGPAVRSIGLLLSAGSVIAVLVAAGSFASQPSTDVDGCWWVLLLPGLVAGFAFAAALTRDEDDTPRSPAAAHATD